MGSSGDKVVGDVGKQRALVVLGGGVDGNSCGDGMKDGWVDIG